MKNWMKKALAMLAAFAAVLSVVMPCAAGGDDNPPGPTYEVWDEFEVTMRD